MMEKGIVGWLPCSLFKGGLSGLQRFENRPVQRYWTVWQPKYNSTYLFYSRYSGTDELDTYNYRKSIMRLKWNKTDKIFNELNDFSTFNQKMNLKLKQSHLIITILIISHNDIFQYKISHFVVYDFD